jgi:mannose-6-phosphate isomerase-like protein (cupin superfamily)
MQISDPGDRPLEQWREGVQTRMVISAANGATQLCVFEQWVLPGKGAPTHSHTMEEVLTVREGEAEMWIDETRTLVRAGQSLIVPARRLHGFLNAGTGTLHVHAILASPIFEMTPEGANEVTRRWTAVS